MLNKGMAVTLDDGQEYGVIEIETVDNIQYCLLINIKDKQEIKICKVSKEDSGIALIELENDELTKIYPKFYMKAKQYLQGLGINTTKQLEG